MKRIFSYYMLGLSLLDLISSQQIILQVHLMTVGIIRSLDVSADVKGATQPIKWTFHQMVGLSPPLWFHLRQKAPNPHPSSSLWNQIHSVWQTCLWYVRAMIDAVSHSLHKAPSTFLRCFCCFCYQRVLSNSVRVSKHQHCAAMKVEKGKFKNEVMGE